MGDMPLMTDKGTFIINGTERVIVSQMHRSPGRVLRPRQGQDAFLGQVPVRRARHPLSRLVARLRVRRQGPRLRAHRPPPQAAGRRRCCMALDNAETEKLRAEREAANKPLEPGEAQGMTPEEILDVLLRPGRLHARQEGLEDRVQRRAHARLEAGLRPDRRQVAARWWPRPAPRSRRAWRARSRTTASPRCSATLEDMKGRYVAVDIINEKTGEIYAEAGDELTAQNLKTLDEAGINTIPTLHIDHIIGRPLHPQHAARPTRTAHREEALIEIYRVMRPGEPPTLETAEALFSGLVLRLRALRPVGGRPRQDELAARHRLPRTPCACCARPTSCRSSRCWSTSRTAAARSTTSTTSATAACARSAS